MNLSTLLSQATEITDNSAEIKAGALFFAISGTKRDGHDFVEEALAKGAFVVVERPEFAGRERVLQVRSTREALGLAASAWYGNPSHKLSLVGVTGTNGKTTTTYLLKQIWEQLGIKSGIVGTVATHIGDKEIPSTHTTPHPKILQKWFSEMGEAKVTHAAVEVTSIALDQYRTAGTTFQVGLFTNLTQDHLDYHRSFEEYYQAKLKFFREYQLPIAIFNIDDAYGPRFLKDSTAAMKRSFSLLNDQADFNVKAADFGKGTTRAELSWRGKKVPIEFSLTGKHNLYNVLGVIAVCDALGMEVEKIQRALKSIQGAPGRLERVMPVGKYPSIFVDYAHTPDALENVLHALHEIRGKSGGRIITVFGCGGDRDRKKRPQMGHIAARLSDVTVVTSDNPRTESPDAIVEDILHGIPQGAEAVHREVNRKSAIDLALSLAKPEDLVLVAGKGHETYQIIGTEQFPFDDRAVIREHYAHVLLG